MSKVSIEHGVSSVNMRGNGSPFLAFLAYAGLWAVSMGGVVLATRESGPRSWPEPADCAVVKLRDWGKVPARFDLGEIATNLGVEEPAVANGTLGKVICPGGLTANQVSAGKVVAVAGIPPEFHVSYNCLATEPVPRHSSAAVSVVCPHE